MALALVGCGDISSTPKKDITAASGPDGIKSTIFVANEGDGSLIAFDPSPNAQGNTLPLIPEVNISPTRRFPKAMVGPMGLFLDISPTSTPPRNTLYVANANGNAIDIYENVDTQNFVPGSAVPTRSISGPNTRLDHPFAIAYDATNDQLFVANRDGNSVLRFQDTSPPSLNGNIEPSGVLIGVESTIFFPRGIAVDPGKDRLYISNVGNDSILVYNNITTVGGTPADCFPNIQTPPPNPGRCNRPPFQIISPHNNLGPDPSNPDANKLAGQLDIPFGIFIDENQDRLYVANTGFNQPGVLIYEKASTLNGGVIPDRVILTNNFQLPGTCSPSANPTPTLPLPPECDTSQLGVPTGVAFDAVNNVLYVVNNNNANNINLSGVANTDSSAVLAFSDPVTSIDNLTKCPSTGTTPPKVCALPPDRRLGGDVTPDATTLTNPVGIALDPDSGTIYVSNPGANNILTFALDGDINPFKINSGNTIRLDNTLLETPSAFFYDKDLDRLFIVNSTGFIQIIVIDQVSTKNFSNTAPSWSMFDINNIASPKGAYVDKGRRKLLVLSTFVSKTQLVVYSLDNITGFPTNTEIGPTGTTIVLPTSPTLMTAGLTPSGPTSMAVAEKVLSGTLSVTNGLPLITGTGTRFTTELNPGDIINIGKQAVTVSSITNDTSLVLVSPYAGVTNPNASGFIVTGDVYISDKGNNRIIVLNLDDPAKNRTIVSSNINQPSGLFIDTRQDILYVTNTGNNTILAFDGASSKDSGTTLVNIPSDRTLSAPTLSSPMAPVINMNANRLFLINRGNNAILTFDQASTLNGSNNPSRTLSGNKTQLNFSGSDAAALLFHDRGNGETLFVGQPVGVSKGLDCTPTPTPSDCPRGALLVFGTEGKVAPSRIFSGGDSVFSTLATIALDTVKDILYAADQGDKTVAGDDAILIITGASSLDSNIVSTSPNITKITNADLSSTGQINNPSGLFIGGKTIQYSGTLSVTEGSTLVIGTGTNFLADDLLPGEIIKIGTNSAIISQINSDTSLDLAAPYPGPSDPNASGIVVPNKLYIANSGRPVQLKGTFSVTDDSTLVLGVKDPGDPVGTPPKTAFTQELKPGDIINIGNESVVVARITSDTKMNLQSRWTAPSDPEAVGFVDRCGIPTTCNILVFDSGQLDQGTGGPFASLQPITNNLALTPMDRPHGIDIDPNTGTIYVANTGGDSVLIFNSDGTPKATLKGVDSQIGRPVDVAFDSSLDILYILNRLDQEILVFSGVAGLNGTVDISPTRVISPVNKGIIASIASDTQFTLTASYTGRTATGMTYGREGTDFSETFFDFFLSGTVSVINGSPTVTGSQDKILDGILVKGTRFTQELELGDTIQVDTSLFTNPTGLFLDTANDLLYVTDQGANAVHIFNNASVADGNVEHRTIMGDNTGLRQPSAIAVNPNTP